MRLTLGRVGFVAAGLFAAGVVFWSLMPRPVPVETAAVAEDTFVATVDEDGKTRVRERYVVAAPLAGRLTRVRRKAGDRVGVEDIVATITPSPAPLLDPRSRREGEERIGMAEAALERANAVVERTQAEAEQADKELARTSALFQRGATTTQSLERAQAAKTVAIRDRRAAEFLLHAAEHELALARALLARFDSGGDAVRDDWSVTAPVSGLVLKVIQESETTVAAGAPIMEIGDPTDLEIVVDVLSTDAVEIKPGAAVTVERWGGRETLRGRVRRVEPTAFTKISTLGVEEQRVNVIVDLLSSPEEWRGLGDGYQADTKITVFVQDNATIVPAGALFRLEGSWHVFVAQHGRAQLRKLNIVRRFGGAASVSAGVTPGERVIVYPSDRIAAGIRVTEISR